MVDRGVSQRAEASPGSIHLFHLIIIEVKEGDLVGQYVT